jgi:putative ABC transport system substrate-binding protein
MAHMTRSGRTATARRAMRSGRQAIPLSPLTGVYRNLIFTLPAQYRLPAVYPYRYYVTDGGLISYGPDLIEEYRPAAGYVDRILKGESPAELPVQAPTKYELAINLKITAGPLPVTGSPIHQPSIH